MLVGKESSAATKAAHRAERTKAKGDEARAAAADDAALEIDPNAQLQLVSAQEGAAVRKGQDKGKGSKAKGPAGADEGEGSSDDDSPVDEPTVVRGRGPTAFAQRSLVAEAFANDDVQADFAAAKRAIIEAEAPREEDLTLPGWGNWGGKGVRKSGAARRRKFVKTIPGLAPEQRKDAKMENVIINEKKDKKAEKYKAKDLPYPYTSAAQYEMAMKAPLGPEWNTRSQHQRLTLPKVVTKPGKAIQPIERKF